MLGRLETEEELERLREFQRQFAPPEEAIMTPTSPPTHKRCANCFGTGTVFGHKVKLTIGGKKCPVCKGATKIEVKEPQ